MRYQFEYPFKDNDIFLLKDNFKKYAHVKSHIVFNDNIVESPDISILVPTYNSPLVIRAIKSALVQKDAPKYNIIIVENGNINNKLLLFIERIKSNCITYYQNEQNIGMFGNWNRCIELSNAGQIVFLHSDDELTNNCLSLLWECHLKVENDACILARGLGYDYEGNYITSNIPVRNKIFGISLLPYFKYDKYSSFHMDYDNGCGALLCKKILLDLGGYDECYYPAADQILLLNYQQRASIYRLNRPTRICYIGFNESIKVVEKYPACGFYVRNMVVDRLFAGCRFLKYIIQLNSESSCDGIFVKKSIRKLNYMEKLLCDIEERLYRIRTYLFMK